MISTDWAKPNGMENGFLERSLLLDGVRYQIVGVMPPGFEYPLISDLPYGYLPIKATGIWVPLALTPQQKGQRLGGAISHLVVARLRPGVSVKEAQSDMSTVMARLDQLHQPGARGWGALVGSFMDKAVGPVRPLMALLLGAVSMVLLIASGNAANLLLARNADRMRELGVRAALGAGRGRLMRQLLTESLLIGLAGGAVGVALAFIQLHALPSIDPGNIPRLADASLDAQVLAFTIAVSLLTSVLTGILPAWYASRPQIVHALKAHGVTATAGGHSRAQSVLIVAESALVVVLLAGAGLLIRSYIKIESLDIGFSQSTLSMNIALDERYSQPQQRRVFFNNIIEEIGALPGVRAVGAIESLPLSKSESITSFWVDGYANQKDQLTESGSVSPQYFSAMGTPLLAGRFFAEADYGSSATPVLVVNLAFANKYFAGRNPLGGHIRNGAIGTVVGVVADVRHSKLEDAPPPTIYYPFGRQDLSSAYIAVRSALPPSTLATAIRTTLRTIDPNLAVADVHTMGDLVFEASAPRRFQAWLLTVFAAIALVLAVVGLYALIAYSVSRRKREMGVRMALGAARVEVMLLVLKNSASLLGFGLSAGLACAWIATRTIKSFLFGVSEHDPLTILTVCGVLAVCGLIAALVPAWRAASIDPMQALRTE